MNEDRKEGRSEISPNSGQGIGRPTEVIPRPETSNAHREVGIRKVANGFIVNVGCQTFVARTWAEASDGLDLYWCDPELARRKYCN